LREFIIYMALKVFWFFFFYLFEGEKWYRWLFHFYRQIPVFSSVGRPYIIKSAIYIHVFSAKTFKKKFLCFHLFVYAPFIRRNFFFCRLTTLKLFFLYLHWHKMKLDCVH
jgi:hypothetical protein